jgi:predicted acyltransferase
MPASSKNQWKAWQVYFNNYIINKMEFKRLLSLDAFRGYTIAAMILVNFPGSWSHVYPPLLHAEWNGLTPTDLIFPFFIFIVGVSIALAYTKLIHKGVSKRKMHGKILFRSVKIFVVGLLLNYIHHFKLSELRYAGVLQRIAIVFLVCSLLFLHSRWIYQLITGTGLLVLYWLAMTLMPTPGYQSAMLEPGINLAAWIDSQLLPGKLWQGTWDPEGILSTVPAFGTCIMGMLTGKIILSEISQDRKVIRLFLYGFTACILGYIWSWDFPLNKNLWTSSYVLLTGGLAMVALAGGIHLVDTLKYYRFARIGMVFGANAITVYVLADLFAFVFYHLPVSGSGLNEHFVALADHSFFSHKFLSMVYALLFTGINFVPAFLLYRKKIYIKL